MFVMKFGIKVIIVGVGFGGLIVVIECHCQGHDVEIYEFFFELKVFGDIILFGFNVGRIFYCWVDGEIVLRFLLFCIDIQDYGFRIYKYDIGEVVYYQRRKLLSFDVFVLNGYWGELYEVIFNYVCDEFKIFIYLGQ